VDANTIHIIVSFLCDTMGNSVTDEKPPMGLQEIRRPTVEEVLAEIDDETVIPTDAVDIVYGRKAAVLNRAIKDMGMGWYQWQLFIVVGFGWASDNLWPVVTSLIFVSASKKFPCGYLAS
jgi:hypothetical protein